MTRKLKFINALIIFLSLVVLVTSNSKFFLTPILNYLLFLHIVVDLFLLTYLHFYLTWQIKYSATKSNIVIPVYVALLMSWSAICLGVSANEQNNKADRHSYVIYKRIDKLKSREEHEYEYGEHLGTFKINY